MMSHGDGRHDELGQELVVLYVQDEINKALTGHGGSLYESPPQPRQEALTLARVLLATPTQNSTATTSGRAQSRADGERSR